MNLVLVEKVVFGKLDVSRYGCPGTIARFVMKKIPNVEYARAEGVAIIQFISSLLNDHYEQCLSKEVSAGRGKTGEQNHSWISRDIYDAYTINLVHKYWPQEEVDAFKEIVRVLAKLHNWEIAE